MGNPLAVSLPTKVSHQDYEVLKSPFFLQVSQNWFPVSERLLATGVLAMSLPLGIVCGQGISPQFVVIIRSMDISHGVYLPHVPAMNAIMDFSSQMFIAKSVTKINDSEDQTYEHHVPILSKGCCYCYLLLMGSVGDLGSAKIVITIAHM